MNKKTFVRRKKWFLNNLIITPWTTSIKFNPNSGLVDFEAINLVTFYECNFISFKICHCTNTNLLKSVHVVVATIYKDRRHYKEIPNDSWKLVYIILIDTDLITDEHINLSFHLYFTTNRQRKKKKQAFQYIIITTKNKEIKNDNKGQFRREYDDQLLFIKMITFYDGFEVETSMCFCFRCRFILFRFQFVLFLLQ